MNLLNAFTRNCKISSCCGLARSKVIQQSKNRLLAAKAHDLWHIIAVGAFSFVVYLLTLAPGIVPGISSVAVLRALKLIPGTSAQHPLWLAATRSVLLIPGVDQVLLLNLFSALCGAIAAAFFTCIVKHCYFELVKDPPELEFNLVGLDDMLTADNEDEDSPPRILMKESQSNCERGLISFAGSMVALFVFIFSAPVWIMSSSLHTQSFHILLIMITAYCTLKYLACGHIGYMVAAVLLGGMGLVESILFVYLVPILIIFITIGSLKFSQISESFFLLVISLLLSGAAVGFALYITLSGALDSLEFSKIATLFSGLVKQHASDLHIGFTARGWIVCVFQILILPFIAIASLMKLGPLQDESTQWKWRIINFVCSVIILLLICEAPGSAWHFARSGYRLPIFSSIGTALATGALFVYWASVTCENTFHCHLELGRPPLLLRIAGYGFCCLFAVVALRTAHTNIDDADGRKTAFVDRLSDLIIKQSETLGIKCVIAEDMLEVPLIIKSYLRRYPLLVLPYRSHGHSARTICRNYTAKAAAPNSPANPKTPSTPPIEFVENWLRTNKGEHGQVAVLGNPCFWSRLDVTPVPFGMLYVTQNTANKLSNSLIMDCFKETRVLIEETESIQNLRPDLAAMQSQLSHFSSRLANDLGVYSESLGNLNEANFLYAEAEKIDANNISAILNRYALICRKTQPSASSQQFAENIRKYASNNDFTHKFDSDTHSYGILNTTQPDLVIPSLIADWGLNPALVAVPLKNLCGRWLKTPMTHPALNSSDIASASTANNETQPQDPQLSEALAMISQGNITQAEKLLRLYVKSQPDSISAMALLTELLIQRKQNEEIRNFILPAMRRALNPTENDMALIAMSEGYLLMNDTPPKFEAARKFFLKALSIKPNLTVAQESLLRASIALSNSRLLEEDASLIISMNKRHALANAVLGGMRKAMQKHEEAEQFLKTSIEIEPQAAALNDYAELLRIQNRFTEAEHKARRAIQIAPTFYQAWDSLSNILNDQGDTDAAYQTLLCALAFGAHDHRLYLTQVRILINQKRGGEALHVINQIAPMLAKAPASIVSDLNHLKEIASRLDY